MPPPALGSGKFDPPWARMQVANLSAPPPWPASAVPVPPVPAAPQAASDTAHAIVVAALDRRPPPRAVGSRIVPVVVAPARNGPVTPLPRRYGRATGQMPRSAPPSTASA